jgi:hypothetical protein
MSVPSVVSQPAFQSMTEYALKLSREVYALEQRIAELRTENEQLRRALALEEQRGTE